MPQKMIRGAQIRYEVIGDTGPWCVMTPAGRSGLEQVEPLARLLAAGGYRVVIHDRRNIGRSDAYIGPETTEDEIFAEDVLELLRGLGALPVFDIGVMAGNRTALNLVLRHPDAVRALIAVFPSGGDRCAEILAERYYGMFADLAEQGGMQAVTESDYYKELIEANPRNRELLLAMDSGEFIATMRRWADGMLASRHWPTIGFSEGDIRRISVPTLAFPGLRDDHIHGYEPGAAIGRLVKGAQTVELAEDRKPADDEGTWIWRAVGQRMRDPALAPAILAFLDERVAAERQAETADPAE